MKRWMIGVKNIGGLEQTLDPSITISWHSAKIKD